MSRRSYATRLVDLALELAANGRLELGHDGGAAHVCIRVEKHWEAYRLPSTEVGRRLRLLGLHHLDAALTSAAVDSAAATLAALAVDEGVERPTGVRIAAVGERVYLDLCDAEWRVVEIDASGWRVTAEAPVVFLRRPGMLPLPDPTPGCGAEGLGELRRLVNLPDEESWALLAGWLTSPFMPAGTLPVLVVEGEAGSGKTSLARMVRALIDPNAAPLRGEPSGLRDLMIAAENSRIVSLENVSAVPVWLSDAICGLASGRGYATRELYTDRGEAIFQAHRPVIITAIDTVTQRDDLADRACTVVLPRISESARRDETTLDQLFKTARPRILGGLLDAVSTALARRDAVVLDAAPRLADWARFVTAAEPPLGLHPGSFLDAYGGGRTSTREDVVGGTIAGDALTHLAERGFEGTATELLNRLRGFAGTTYTREWPQTPLATANLVRHLAGALRVDGFEVEFTERAGGKRARIITLRRPPSRAEPA